MKLALDKFLESVTEQLEKTKEEIKNSTILEDVEVSYVSKGVNIYFQVDCYYRGIQATFLVEITDFEEWFKIEYPTIYYGCFGIIDLDGETFRDFEVDTFMDLNDWQDLVEEYLEVYLKAKTF